MKRGAEFEIIVRRALFESGTARPILGSVAVRAGGPGQWDGVVVHEGKPALVESKANLSPLRNFPKLHKRAAEAEACGIGRILFVSLAGFARHPPARMGSTEIAALAFSSFTPCPPPGIVALSTGDRLSCGPSELRHPSGGEISSRTAIPARRSGAFVLLETQTYTALKRACFFAAQKLRAELAEVEPLGRTAGEIGRLWRAEDLLSGFYSPPLRKLQDIFRSLAAGREEGISDTRLAANVSRILGCAGVRPGCGGEAIRRAVLEFPPFLMWREARKGRDVQGALRHLRDFYDSYRPYAVCPYNPNKARACERYIRAALSM